MNDRLLSTEVHSQTKNNKGKNEEAIQSYKEPVSLSNEGDSIHDHEDNSNHRKPISKLLLPLHLLSLSGQRLSIKAVSILPRRKHRNNQKQIKPLQSPLDNSSRARMKTWAVPGVFNDLVPSLGHGSKEGCTPLS